MVPPEDTDIVESCPAQLSEGSETKEFACESLLMCIVTTLNQGLRNGGGIGDILRYGNNIFLL